MKGKSYTPEKFKIIEANQIADINIINDMLKGEGSPIYVIRNFVPASNTVLIKEKFSKVIKETNGGNRSDFVKTFQIGANQWSKNSVDFFRECDQTRHNVNSLLEGLDENVANDFMLEKTFINHFIEKGIYFGPSYYKGNYCNLFTARLWVDDEENNALALQPHEDLAQVKYAGKDNFEICSVRTVIACNLCVDNDTETNLLLWNISPDEEVKKKLNLEETGYPYPPHLVEGIDCLKLNTQPGDLYFINANFLHGVEKSRSNVRITLGRFIGYIANGRIAYWT